jgi:diacylglycerol O-acyltransferase / wax synthase
MARSEPGPGEQTLEWGTHSDMSEWEGLMWRLDVDPRTRSTGALVEILDSAPDWERLVAAHERVSLAIPRLRDRVVEPPLPLVPPAFSRDDEFHVENHLSRMRLTTGTMRELLDFTAGFLTRPFAPARPPWEGMLVDGLEGGRAAYVLRMHHSLTDGQGLVQLMSMAHSRTREPGRRTEPRPLPPGEHLTPVSLLASRLARKALGTPGRMIGRAGKSVALATRTVTRPTAVVGDGIRFARSLKRVLTPPPAQRSPLISGKGSRCAVVALEVPLADLKAAGKAGGGSVNDAFLAALLGGFRRYHEHFGTPIDHMPMAIPISLRTADDPAGGNRFAGARFAAPIGEPDPRERIAAIREFVLSARDEPAIGFLDILAPAMARLPRPAVIALAANMASVSDLQASNIPGLGHPVYLAGAEITHTFPFGPRPGVSCMAAMLSYNGKCCVGFNFDPDAITDIKVFEHCMQEGFDEVLELRKR